MDGKPYWNGLQLDETALPILLADTLRRHKALDDLDPYPMVRRAAQFLISTGPCSPMDRWEENAGYSTFTLAAMIAALLAAADFADGADDKKLGNHLREIADDWYGRIDGWTYVTGTETAKKHGVEGYYIRIAPPDVEKQGGPAHAKIELKNQQPGQGAYPASEIVSPDALSLVRYGLRKADDARITNTVKVVDATLKTDTATGPVWHRHTHDGYGETADGAPFKGAGIGRGWPLLAGERAHYEIARGNRDEAKRLLHVLTRQTSNGGMLPEQVWEAGDIPERCLINGKPSGSAMPLVWAHAETLKLIRSLEDNRVWDMPPQTVERYLHQG